MKKTIRKTFGLRDITRVSDLKCVVGGRDFKTRAGHATDTDTGGGGTTSGDGTTTGIKTGAF